MADFGAGRGKYKISLEHFVMPEGKKDKTYGNVAGTREGVSVGQI